MSKTNFNATKIMIIRHAEKPSSAAPDVPPYGVSDTGDKDSESLTIQGWQRAGALTCFFDPAYGPLQNSHLAKPQFLYASKPSNQKNLKHGSRRPDETITPLANKLGLEINIDFMKGKEEKMVEDALQKSGIVLICWQHENIPISTNEGPGIAKYILDTGSYNFSQVPQCLLYGDSPDPIKGAPDKWPDDRFDVVWVFDLKSTLST
jgi:hypothetical protein